MSSIMCNVLSGDPLEPTDSAMPEEGCYLSSEKQASGEKAKEPVEIWLDAHQEGMVEEDVGFRNGKTEGSEDVVIKKWVSHFVIELTKKEGKTSLEKLNTHLKLLQSRDPELRAKIRAIQILKQHILLKGHV